MSLLEIDALNKTYNATSSVPVHALRNIHLQIERGELIAIVGTSGSGKSTLLRILGCIDQQTSGTYRLAQQNIFQQNDAQLATIRNKSIGFIMQDFALIDYYSVKKNILLPLVYEKNRALKQQRKRQLSTLLTQLHIQDKINDKVSNLSGGQRQRVAIARALINEPAILLADEPTGALDEKTTEEIMQIFLQLHEAGKTIIIVTHDMNIAQKCQRIFTMQDGTLTETSS